MGLERERERERENGNFLVPRERVLLEDIERGFVFGQSEVDETQTAPF